MTAEGSLMRKPSLILLLVLISALPAMAGQKLKGSTTLKDFQPAGTTDKNQKTQRFDLSFIAVGNEYTCRTKDKTKATDFVVGADVKYEIDNDKVKLKNASGKQAECTVVRVEKASGVQSAEAPK
jgi:hypothetical protein